MKRLLFLSLCACVLAACGGGSSTPETPIEPDSGLLRKVSSPAELERSLKSGLTMIRSSEEIETASLAAAGADNFTGTYTQEKNVDEFDAVRYDGEHLYVAPRRYSSCCIILGEAGADGAVGTAFDPERSIRVLSTDPDGGSAKLESRIPLDDNVSVQGMYVAEDRLFALTGTAFYGRFGGLWADFAVWAPEKLGFQVYDVSNPGNPVPQYDAEIDGVFIESRRIGDTVYIVSRYTPRIDGIDYYVTTVEQQAHNQMILDRISLDDLLPRITVNGVSARLVAPERCYISNADEVSGYPVITSITAVPIGNPGALSTTCYNEQTIGAYVSENAIYLTQQTPRAASSLSETRIHKFALASTELLYRGSAEIQGNVWRGGQADFRMSEYRGDLRILASQFDWNNEDFVDHTLYVLRESTTRRELTLVSQLPNENRPEEIGKPNEVLYGVRFLGERAYAVTFEQIDPLYAIDLSDPADPRIAGELQVTGFSDFLHPVNDSLLLGVGIGANGGIKLELFDVSDLAQPLSRGSTTLGGRGSRSEATYDRHAFAYQSDVNGVDRFAIPAEIYATDGSFDFVELGLYLFEIRDKETPALAALSSVGSIVPAPDEPETSFLTRRNRAYIHNDTVYYVRDEAVWAAFWHSPTLANGPF